MRKSQPVAVEVNVLLFILQAMAAYRKSMHKSTIVLVVFIVASALLSTEWFIRPAAAQGGWRSGRATYVTSE
jgi:hypothetical protein